MILHGLSLIAAAAMPQDPAPGISRELARERAALVRDVEYDLRFTLDDTTEHVEGTVFLRFRLDDDTPPKTFRRAATHPYDLQTTVGHPFGDDSTDLGSTKIQAYHHAPLHHSTALLSFRNAVLHFYCPQLLAQQT